MFNFYDIIPKAKEDKYVNRPEAKLMHPYRLIITGASGSGKTEILMHLIWNNPVFDQYYIYCKSLGNDRLYDQGLIEMIKKSEKRFGRKMLMDASNNLDSLPDINDIGSPKLQKLMIFDDFMFDKSDNIGEYFARARKMNLSLVYITQNISRTPIDIRRNIDSIAVTNLTMTGDIRILANNFLMSRDDFLTLLNKKKRYLLKTESGDGTTRIYVDDVMVNI